MKKISEKKIRQILFRIRKTGLILKIKKGEELFFASLLTSLLKDRNINISVLGCGKDPKSAKRDLAKELVKFYDFIKNPEYPFASRLEELNNIIRSLVE